MIKFHNDLVQGSDDWLAARCGLLTASEMKNIITAKTLAYSASEKTMSHVYELAAQRITKHVEPHYVSDDMLRGHDEEFFARELYRKHYDDVEEVGFVTNDKFGFVLGCSPDGLVGLDGGIEIKSRCQKIQFKALCELEVPAENVIQIQTCLIVTERKWWDYISYSNGMRALVLRVYPESRIQNAILNAATQFEETVREVIQLYKHNIADDAVRTVQAERRVTTEIITV